jgi:hypothetical protein
MMLKVIDAGAQTFDEPVMQLVKVSSRGLLGGDRSLFIKRASARLAHEVDAILPRLHNDEPLVHLLAIGATEDYGCFVAGTPIAMADGNYLPVEDLQKEDLVLSADGNFCEVSYLFRRHVPQTVILDVCGLPDTLQCSCDHPFRVARKEQFVCDHDKYKRCLPPTFGQQNICNRTKTPRDCVISPYRNIAWEWAGAASINEGDFLIWTAPTDLPIPLDISPTEGYLLGAWLAEGCFQRNASNRAVASIRLDIHRDELVFAGKLFKHATALDLTATKHDYDENSRVVCITGNPERFRLWLELFGEHVRGKRVPPWVCSLPYQTRLAIIAGYIDGDGSCVVDEKENRTTIRSHGKTLAIGMQRLCWSVGMPAVCCAVGDNEGWNLAIANSYLDDLVAWSWKIAPRELKQTTKVHGFFHEGRMYLPVRGISQAGAADVFNFEVAGDHTYSGPNVDSHNCNRNGDGFKRATCENYHPTFVKYARFYRSHKNKDPRKSYGLVKASEYSQRMKRIELLAALNGSLEAANRNGGLLADQEMEKLAAGKEIPVSMACRIPFDVCSYCGNKAPSPQEYCWGTDIGGMCKAGGLRDNMGALVEIDGGVHQLHADNPHPCFFDISHVFRPADRIAYVTGMLKAASASNVVSGAELARALGVTMPAALMIDGDQPANVQRMLKMAYQLADAEQDLGSCQRQAELLAQSPAGRSGVLPQPPLFREKLSLALRALADARVMLPLEEFIGLFTDNTPEKSAEVAAVVRSELPGIHGRLLADPQLPSRLAVSPYTPDSRQPPPVLSQWATKIASDYSLAEPYIRRRAQLAVLRGATVPQLQTDREKVASVSSGNARRMAEEYALYQLGFLNQISETDSALPLTARAVTLQNHLS